MAPLLVIICRPDAHAMRGRRCRLSWRVPCRQLLRLVDRDGLSWRQPQPQFFALLSSQWHCQDPHWQVMEPLGDEGLTEADTPRLDGSEGSLINLWPEYLLPLEIIAHSIR